MLAEAPASGIKVAIARCEWHADGPAHSTASPPATITDWKLAKAPLLGSGSIGGLSRASSPIILRHREPAALTLTVQCAEPRLGGGVKMHTASSKTKVNPVTLTQVCALNRFLPAPVAGFDGSAAAPDPVLRIGL